MSKISIQQEHTLTLKKARAAAQKIADKLSEEYDMTSEWNGDVLSFSRSGVHGTLAVAEGSAQLDIKLGMMMAMFAGPIEEEVSKKMKTVFAAKK
jgi:putative polyhydroxyalkanoate system protein